jgi:cAMP-dependent protein kinase regulator
MGCIPSVPVESSSGSAKPKSSSVPSTTNSTAAAVAPNTTATTTTTTTNRQVTTTMSSDTPVASTNAATAAATTTRPVAVAVAVAAAAAPPVLSPTVATAVEATPQPAAATVATTAPQRPAPPQRIVARNIFAKPIVQTVLTAATTAANHVTDHTHTVMTNVTNAISNLTTTAAATTTTTTSPNTSTTLPYYEKTPEITNFLLQALPRNFVFENCSTEELQQVCNSMEPYSPQGSDASGEVHTDDDDSKQQQEQQPIVIIEQGTMQADYCYIIYQGSVTYHVNQVQVGTGTVGDCFGELSLLYSAPRAATVMTQPTSSSSSSSSSSSVILYRLDQITFRTILQQQTQRRSSEQISILKRVAFLSELDDYSLHKVSAVLQTQTFTKDTVIVQKGDVANADVCYILVEGTVRCSDISIEGSNYEDITLNQCGDYFGERAILTGEPRAATVTAMSDTVLCYTMDRLTFQTVLGNYHSVIAKANDERILVRVSISLIFVFIVFLLSFINWLIVYLHAPERI